MPAPNFIDLTNQVFGRLTVLSRAANDSKHSSTMWRCKCSCGKEVEVRGGNLRSGSTRSCGCLQREKVAQTGQKASLWTTTHGHYRNSKQSPTYTSWYAMRQRCTNSNHISYKYYGGRGIKICPECNSFTNFLADMGKRPEGTTLGRINGDGNYEPNNVEWQTDQQQCSERDSRRMAMAA